MDYTIWKRCIGILRQSKQNLCLKIEKLWLPAKVVPPSPSERTFNAGPYKPIGGHTGERRTYVRHDEKTGLLVTHSNLRLSDSELLFKFCA